MTFCWSRAMESPAYFAHIDSLPCAIRENACCCLVADDDIVNYETLRLVSMSDGVFYIAKVAHNEFPVPFRLTHCADGEAVFENPLHDAPERLVYRLLEGADAGALEVRVEGGEMDDFSLLFYRP